MPSRPHILGVLAIVAAGCGSPTTPEGFPELAETYIGSLEAEFTSVPGGVRTSGVPCALTLTIASQSGNTFQGSYHRGTPCVVSAYPVTGSLQRDGALTVQVAGGDGAFQGFDECRYVSGEERWRGDVDGDGLTLRIDVVLACAQSGTQRTVATFEGRASRR